MADNSGGVFLNLRSGGRVAGLNISVHDVLVDSNRGQGRGGGLNIITGTGVGNARNASISIANAVITNNTVTYSGGEGLLSSLVAEVYVVCALSL